MVGKRIRCRQCSTVFPVVAGDADKAPADLKPAVVSAGGRGAGGSVAGGSVSGSSVTAMAHHHLADDDPISAARADSGEPVFTSTETAPNWFVRGSRPQPFPASRLLERWVPLALPAILAAWAVQESFSDDHSGKVWVPIFRILVVAALFLGVAVPLTLQGVYQGLRLYRYAPPPKPYWRTVATFCLPATLGFVLWMVGGGAFNFLAGCIVGVVVAAPVYWLLFRQDWSHAGLSYAISGGTFLVSAAIGMALMGGVNFGLNQILIAAHKANTFQHSPLNDNLSWTVPPAQKSGPARQQPGKNSAVVERTTDADAAPPEGSPPPAPDPRGHAESTSSASSDPIATSHGRAPVATGSEVSAHNEGVPQPIASPRTGVTSPEKLFTTNDAGPAVPDSLIGRIKAANRPWITAVGCADEIAENHFVLPLVPSKFIGLVRNQPTGGAEIECCALSPYTRIGTLPLISPTEDSVGLSRYAISPDGKQLLRLADFPHFQIEVESFDRPGEILSKTPLVVSIAPFNERSILPDRSFAPQLLGALPNHQVLIRWSRQAADIEILEVWDYQQQVNKLRRLARPATRAHPSGNYAVSPDGKWFAATASNARNLLAMWVYSLGGPKQPLTFSIPEMDAQRWDADPIGMAFSSDGRRLAVLFEHDAEGFIITWDVEAGRRVRDTVCPLPTARAVAQLGGSQRALSWLSDDVLLVHGVTLLQASTGAVIGSLTDDAVYAQQVADDHTIYLAYPEGGSTRLATVSFDSNKLPVVPQEKKRIIP